MNSIACLIRLPIIVLGQACVQDQASNTRLVVSDAVKSARLKPESVI